MEDTTENEEAVDVKVFADAEVVTKGALLERITLLDFSIVISGKYSLET